MASHIAVSQERLTEFQLATREDPDMRRLTQVIQAGWPENRGDLPLNVQSYFSFREELSVQNGLIFKGERIVVPNTEGLRSKVLGLLHESHRSAGMLEKSKRSCLLARHDKGHGAVDREL